MERESVSHAAVGKAMDIGSDVRDASKRGGQLLGKGGLMYFAGAMAFGLLTSNTPLWFKAMMFAAGYGAYRLYRAAARHFEA